MRTKGKKLTVNKWDVYRSQMEQREYNVMFRRSVAMTQVGEELNEEIDKWCDNRRGWVKHRVTECISQRRIVNRNYRI